MPDVMEFELASFDKAQIKTLIERIRKVLTDEGIENYVWMMEPHAFTLQVKTSRQDYSIITQLLFDQAEVLKVQLDIEPASRVMLARVLLKERWFLDGQEEKPARRRHPEDGGTPV